MAKGGTYQFQPKTLDHISFAVKDIGKVIEAWSLMFGMGPWTYRDGEGTDVEGHSWKGRFAYTFLGPVEIELIQPVEGKMLQSDLLDTWGEGIHHLGFLVDDVEKEIANLTAQGAKLLLNSEGYWAYLDPGTPGGLVLELMSREWLAKRRRHLVQEWK